MDLGGLKTTLIGIHAMLAGMMETPELEMTDNEADLLLGAAQKVARHYDTGFMSEKQVDWLNLFSALGMVYGTRVMAIRLRAASDAAKDVTPKTAPQPGPTNNGPQRARAAAGMSEAEAARLLNSGFYGS